MGTPIDQYIAFLEDEQSTKFQDEESDLVKNGDFVTIEINDYLFPGHPALTITKDNLLKALKEWHHLKQLKLNKIKIVFEDDTLTMTGE